MQAVLDADVWRKHLLREQEKISKELASIEEERSKVADTSSDAARLDKQREGLDITLSDVHAKLSEMDSDRAEPRAEQFATDRLQRRSPIWRPYALLPDLRPEFTQSCCFTTRTRTANSIATGLACLRRVTDSPTTRVSI